MLAEEKPIQTDGKPRYDFSDLSGKLAWSGDAVAEQRALISVHYHLYQKD